jgi:putative GTP pyrophosphokinase
VQRVPDPSAPGDGAPTAPVAMPDPAELRALMRDMRRLALTYKFGIDEVMTKIAILRDEFRHMQNYNPVEHVGSRLKSFESIVAKCRRKGIPLTPEAVRAEMFDIAGVRVTCSFVSDIYRVRDMLVGQSDLTLLEERDYIAHPKGNGYKSLHLIVQVPVYLSDRVEDVIVEIQIRTIAMDFWASLEHKIYYKYGRQVPRHLTDSLKLAADVAASLDASMERIHEEVKALAGEEQPVEHAEAVLDPEELLRSFWPSPDTDLDAEGRPRT